MIRKFALFCKSYSDDVRSFSRLVKSFAIHNVDSLHLIVSVPECDVPVFRDAVGTYQNVEVISDESYASNHLISRSHWGMNVGYLNQEVCKLAFWEAQRAENYLCVDSDALFIRDFRQSDFIAAGDVPYSVLVMDKDLLSDPSYSGYCDTRRSHVDRIFKAVELDDSRRLTCHGMTIINSRVMTDLKHRFMTPKSLGYGDLLGISPLEFTWYNAWLQKSGVIPVLAVEPFFKTFHTREEFALAQLRLVSSASLAQCYVGVILNSNWFGRKRTPSLGSPSWKLILVNRFLCRYL